MTRVTVVVPRPLKPCSSWAAVLVESAPAAYQPPPLSEPAMDIAPSPHTASATSHTPSSGQRARPISRDARAARSGRDGPSAGSPSAAAGVVESCSDM